MAENLIKVATFADLPPAELARMALEQEGIPAIVVNDITVGMLSYVGQAVGDVHLLVAEDRAARAAEIIASHAIESRPARTPSRGNTCLACDAEMAATDTRCAVCGWTFAEEEDPSEDSGRVSEESARPGMLSSARKLGTPIVFVVLVAILAVLLLRILYVLLRVVGDLFR